MRRLLLLAAVLALVGAGVAVAHDGGDGGKTVAATSATFTATTGGNVRTDTCTGSDNDNYATTHGEWTGTATSTDPSLSGNATIDAWAVVNTTTGFGSVSGQLRIDGTAGHTEAQFDGVYSNGQIVGLAEGHGSAAWSRLVADLSATWSPTAGFTNGTLGGGASETGQAIELTSGGCQPQQQQQQDVIEVHGTLSAASSTSITADGVTCAVPTNLASSVASLQTGQRVEMKCSVSSGSNTLVSLDQHNGGDHGGDNQNNQGEHHSQRHH